MELTEVDAGAARPVAVGEEIVVRLPENRTTGFRWQLAGLPDDVTLVDDGYEAPATGRPGEGGVHTFRLRPTAAGDRRVAVTLGRSWGTAAPERTLEFTVRVS